MDKIVEHVWALGEDGSLEIKDYPGNYTQYRLALKEKLKEKSTKGKQTQVSNEIKGDYSVKLSFKDKFEFEGLEPQISKLEAQRDKLSQKIETCTEHEDLLRVGAELGRVSEELEKAEMRWLELSERV